MGKPKLLTDVWSFVLDVLHNQAPKWLNWQSFRVMQTITKPQIWTSLRPYSGKTRPVN